MISLERTFCSNQYGHWKIQAVEVRCSVSIGLIGLNQACIVDCDKYRAIWLPYVFVVFSVLGFAMIFGGKITYLVGNLVERVINSDYVMIAASGAENFEFLSSGL